MCCVEMFSSLSASCSHKSWCPLTAQLWLPNLLPGEVQHPPNQDDVMVLLTHSITRSHAVWRTASLPSPAICSVSEYFFLPQLILYEVTKECEAGLSQGRLLWVETSVASL